MGDVYMLNGKILSGLPNHAKDIVFDNTGTTLSSTNTEDAIKEVNSNLSKHTGGTSVIITNSLPYTCPSDGYVSVGSNDTVGSVSSIFVADVPLSATCSVAGIRDFNAVFVRKDTVITSRYFADTGCDASFKPLV